MADNHILALSIENTSSMAWSASERYQKELAELSRAAQQHLYIVVVGPELIPIALNASQDQPEWNLEITCWTSNGPRAHTITVSESAFPDSVLEFDPTRGVLALVPTAGTGKSRKITVAEVVRAAINVGHEKPEAVDAIVGEFFNFEVAYIGQSYGENGSLKAIDRLTKGHKTVERILSEIQDFSPNRSVALITLDQQLTRVDAQIRTDQGEKATTSKAMQAAALFREILSTDLLSDGPLSKMTVDAAEASLITAFNPEWNQLLKDFTQKEAPTMVRKLKDKGYTHLRIHIDLKDAQAQIKGPHQGIPSPHHSWTFNLDTGAIESAGSGSWHRPNTNF
jgi:hypothetical protein